MREDVQALIQSLLAERDVIDQALGALSALSGAPRQGGTTVAHQHLTDDQKRAAAVFMMSAHAQSVSLTTAAREFAARHDMKAVTIESNWRMWARKLGVTAKPEGVEVAEAVALA